MKADQGLELNDCTLSNTLKSAFCCGIYSCFRFSFDNMMIFSFLLTVQREGLLGEFNAWLAELLRLEVYGTEVYKLLSHCWVVLLLQMLWPSAPKMDISCLEEESQPYKRNHTEFPTPSRSGELARSIRNEDRSECTWPGEHEFYPFSDQRNRREKSNSTFKLLCHFLSQPYKIIQCTSRPPLALCDI